MTWFEDLEHYFLTRWRDESGRAGVPEAVYEAMRRVGGEKFKADLLHPIDYEDGRIAWLMLSGEEAFLFQFDPPTQTTIKFLGSLAGGRYTEVIDVTDEGRTTMGTFKHPRLDDNDAPLRVVYTPPKDSRVWSRPGVQEADERSQRLLLQFRNWSREPLLPQPPAG